MDRAPVPHPIDPRLVKKEPASQVGLSTTPMTSLKDPRGPRLDPDPVRSDAHGNGNSSGVPGAGTADLSMGDKAKREEGYEAAADPQSRDHKPSAYQVAHDSDVNAPVGEQRTAPNLLPQHSSFPSQVQQPGRGNKQDPPVGNLAPSTNSAAGMPTGHQSSTGGSKIFVGGLSWETDEGSLRGYFETFGEVLDCVIMRDRHTGHPRGFGFVTFADDSVAERAATRRHDLDGRQVEAKRAVPRNEFPIGGAGGASSQQQGAGLGMAASGYGVRSAAGQDPRYGAQAGYAVGGAMRNHHTTRGKVFVGGLPSSCGNEEFKAYFQSYGEVVDAQVMIDHNTGNSRGFGFVTFANEATVETVVGPGRSNTRHEIMGKNVEVKRAEPKGMSTTSRRHDAYGSGAGAVGMRGAGGGAGNSSNLGGAPDAGSNAANAAAAAYYGNYASASLAEQYGAYYNNPQWQSYYAAMGYNFNAYPQGYNPYSYLSAYMQNVANGSSAGGGMAANDPTAAAAASAAHPGGSDVQGAGYDAARGGGPRYGNERDGSGAVGGAPGGNGALGGGGSDAAGGPGSGSGGRRSSRRDERYHPYR